MLSKLKKERNEAVVLKQLLEQTSYILTTSFSAEDLFLEDSDYEKLNILIDNIIQTLIEHIAMYDEAILKGADFYYE